jgi:diguanylate cyclase (GGDEF)-like protein
MDPAGLPEDHEPGRSPAELVSPWDDPDFDALHADAGPSTEIQRAFWLRHMRIGFGVFLAETVMVMLYLMTTPDGMHRALLEVTVAGWFVIAIAGLFAAPRLASAQWRVVFSASWTVASCVAVGLVATFDGGAESPLLYLLFLPIANAALAYSPAVTAACGLSALGTMGVVDVTDPGIGSSSEAALVLASVMVGATILSVASSINRTHRESRERVLSDQVAELAATDGLTRCAVHRVFHRRLEEEIGRSMRSNRPLSLLLIDVDNFKAVNDNYGHLVGDQVLASVGRVLLTETRSFEMVGRLGGDEFAVLLPETEPSAGAIVAERLRNAASRAVTVPVTLSIGVSSLDLATPTAERMLDDADFGLYQVKHAGRDGVAVRPPSSPISSRQ